MSHQNLMNRRRFINRVTTGTAAAIIPASVKGANEKIRVGIIGVGGRGTALLREFIRMSDAGHPIEVAAVCDVYNRRIRQAEEISGARGYADWNEVIARSDIDAVVIATPDHWHTRMTIAACNAGKDVFVEKPMTQTFQQALDVQRAVRANERVLQVGAPGPSQSSYRNAGKIVRAGIIGTLLQSFGDISRHGTDHPWNWRIEPEAGPDKEGENHIDWEMWLGDAPKVPYNPDRFFRFRKYWDYSGGRATDVMSHMLSWMMTAWGRAEFPLRMTHTGGRYYWQDDPLEMPDVVAMTGDFPSGHSVVMTGTDANDLTRPITIKAHMASIEIHNGVTVTPQALYIDDFQDRVEAAGIEGQITEEAVRGGWGVGGRGLKTIVMPVLRVPDEPVGYPDPSHIQNFFDCVRTREEPNHGIDFGIKIMAAMDMLVRSYREGKTMYFDEKIMRVTDVPMNLDARV